MFFIKEQLSLFQFRHAIANNLNACIYNQENEPVAWALIKMDSSSGAVHTKEAYRNMGLGSTLYHSIAKKHEQCNIEQFGYTEISNKRALHVPLNKFGVEAKDKVVFLKYTPPRSKL